MSFQSDISKLIFHHLVKEGYESSASNLIRECPHLIELKRVQPPYKLPRLMGPSLVNLIENYFETKENVIEQLELLKSVVFREQDDLQNLNKTLVENLKFQTPLSSQTQKETADAGVNTIAFSQDGPQTCDASVNTESANTPETCDASVNTESISTPKTSDSSCNTDCVTNRLETCDASVNTEAVFNQENNDANHVLDENSQVLKEKHDGSEIPDVIDSQEDVPNQCLSPKSPTTLPTSQVPKDRCDGSVNTAWMHNHDQENSLHCSEQLEASAETIDFSLVYDRLLENREFQEKIAQNINKKKAEAILPSKGSSKSGNLASSQDLDIIIKAIVAETQADPAFDNFLNDCIGIDSEDQTSVGTPDSSAQEGEPTVSHYNGENQENCLVPSNLGAPMIIEPSTIASSIFTVKNSNLLDNSSTINGLSSMAIVTSSGQITLVPTIISAISSDAVPSVGEQRKKKIPTVKRPVAIAPKPFFTITIPALDGNDQFPNAVGESEFFEDRDKVQLVDCNTENINVESSPRPSKTKPIKVKSRQMVKSRRKKAAKTSDSATEASKNPPSSEKFITPGLAALVKIAQEYGSTSMSDQDQEAVREKEPSKSSDVVFDSPVPNSADFVTTPTSTRRLSHVRQLNFGESPELSKKPASASPVVHSKRSEIPWDLALRNAIAAPPPPDSEIFATPKGKAKRRRKSSPPPLIETEPVEKTSVSDPVASTSTFSTIPHQTSSFDSSTPSDQNAATSIVSEQTPSVCDSTDSSYADLVAASILHEMANTPVIEIASVESLKPTSQENKVNERVSPEPNLPNFGMNTITREEPVIQQPLPILATPRKEMVENVAGINSTNSVTHAMFCDGQSNSTSFGAWDGEIPRTPQIRLDLTSSTSPFQVSLTKGFCFLPAAESPSLPVPATPCIFEVNSSSTSIETPYTGFYQFPSVLSTPRLEALRQEIMESPGKSMSTTVISPTQVVLGRPTPYFVPSGERAQGPVNQNATPEHVPETEKLERRRRSSTDMDPLQLEESNDASDAAAALMCKAAESVAAALQPPSPLLQPSTLQPSSRVHPLTPLQPPTPYKTDQTLENDLISECQRLQDDPSSERVKLRNQRLVELFGEDSTNPSEITNYASSVPENASAVALAQSTPITAKPKTRKPRRTAHTKPAPGDESGISLSPQPHRRKSQRRTNNSKPSTSREDENLIQEVLALSRLNSSVDPLAPSPFNKRKRRSDSTSGENNGMTVSSEKRSKRKRKNVSDASEEMREEQSLATVVPISTLSTGSSKEDVSVKSVSTSPKKSKEGKKTTKEKVKPGIRTAAKSISPKVMGMATRRTPVKLFKSSQTSQPPYARKRVSKHQSIVVQKVPEQVHNEENRTDTGITNEERSLELESVEVIGCDLRVNTHVKDYVPPTEDFNGKDDSHNIHLADQVSDATPISMETTSTATENVSQYLVEGQPQMKFPTENVPKKPEEIIEIIEQEPLTQPNIAVDSAPIDFSGSVEKASNNEKASEDVVIGASVIPTMHKDPTSSTCISVLSSCTENPHERIVSRTAETPCNLLFEQRTPLTEEPPLAAAPAEASTTNCVEVTLPFLEQKLQLAQKSSDTNAVASKEKVNQSSNSKVKNYLRLLNLSTASPKKNLTGRNVSAGKQGSSVTHLKSPTNSNYQHWQLQEAKIVMHKEFVNKIRKELTTSEEIDLYSQ